MNSFKGKKALPRYTLSGKVFWQTTRATSAGASLTLGINVDAIPSELIKAFPEGSATHKLLCGEGDKEKQKGFVFKKSIDKEGKEYPGYSVFVSGLTEYMKGIKNVENGDIVDLSVVANVKVHDGNPRIFLNIKEIKGATKPEETNEAEAEESNVGTVEY